MKPIFETSNSIDANIILGMLKQAGLDARVEGEFLQGGVGELSAVNIVRVVVNESDYDEAIAIVAEWDAIKPPVRIKKPIRWNYSMISALGGLVIGVLLMMLFYRTPVTSSGIDYNGDGKLDEKWFYSGGLIYKAELDRNFDGKVDLVYDYDRRGLLETSRSDDNFDGVFESESRYEQGNIAWMKADTTGDGFKDYEMDFAHGILVKTIFLNPLNRKPLKIQYFNEYKMSSAEIDSDRDGVLDTAYTYDELDRNVTRDYRSRRNRLD